MAAVENEQGYVLHGSMDGPELAPYPPYVQTEEDTARWDAAYGIAEGLSRMFEQDGQADPKWVWYTTRALYNDRSIPTGVPAEIQEAGLEHDEERVAELLAELERRAPAAAESAEQLDSYLEALADYFDGLLGDPDEWIPEEAERDYSHEVAAAWIDEAFVPHVPGTYNAALHPRARGGKWARKFGVAHRVINEHPQQVEAHAADEARRHEMQHPGRGAELKQRLHRARIGGVVRVQTAIANALTSEHPVTAFHEKHDDHSPLKGRKNVVAGAAEGLLPDPRKSGAQHGGAVSTQDAIEIHDRIEKTVEQSVGAAKWAHDHADVLRAAGSVAHHVLRAKGIAAADISDPSKAVQEKLAAHMPGGEPADQIHLTLVFLTPDASQLEDKKTAIMEAVREAASEHGPLKGTVGGIAAFRGMPDADVRPVIATTDIVGLNEFRADLMRQLRLRQAAPEETHGFTPHLTLKYAPKDDPVPEPPAELPLEFDEVVLVWDEKKTAFPLAG
jgi:2'-5' RNA ligase